MTCLFTVSHFIYRDHRAKLTADVEVRSSDGRQRVLLERGLEVLSGKAPTLRPGQVRSAARLALSPAAAPGRYTLTLSATDHFGRRSGRAAADFVLLGTPTPASARLTITALRNAGDARVPSGSVVPIAFEVRGLGSRAVPTQGKADASDDRGARRQLVDLALEAELLDARNHVVLRRPAEPLRRARLLFAPRSYPVEHTFVVPKELKPGAYRVRLTVIDRVTRQRAVTTLPLEVSPRPKRISVHNIHMHDAAGLPRASFALGEQSFVRLSVQGFSTRAGRAAVEVDLGVAGPDGGIYLARKNVSPLDERTAKIVARLGRRPLQVPLVLPALAPTGSYRLVIRARDTIARRTATREHRFRLAGAAPKPLSTLTVDQLQVRPRPDLPAIEGDSFIEGRRYHLVMRVGGIELKPQGKATYLADLEASLTLRGPRGEKVAQPKLSQPIALKRQLRYQPLRLLIPIDWTVPAGLPPGLYTLQVRVLNKVDDMVSQLTRRVAIYSAGRVADIKL